MTRLIILGGFLGSGKTSTILRLADYFVRRGNRVGILTNDQGQELVDSDLFRTSGLETRDVRGGCFCCRFTDFFEQAELLKSRLNPEVLLAEPVGSCTDLVATVLRPLRHLHPDHFEISPFTVLVDPLRARDVLGRAGNAALSAQITYVYRLQQTEADAIAVNKTDMLLPDELADVVSLLRAHFPAKRILAFSARTGEGFEDLAAWLTSPNLGGLSRSPEIDYDVYAAGEAELAWFDARFGVCALEPVDMDEILMQLGSLLGERLSAGELHIAHIKLLLRAGEKVCLVNISRSDATPELSHSAAACAQFLDLLVNARVAARPSQLATIMEDCLQSWAEMYKVLLSQRSVSSFSPPRPVPTHRIG